eukprot:3038793-Prymnesium_polylepis.1
MRPSVRHAHAARARPGGVAAGRAGGAAGRRGACGVARTAHPLRRPFARCGGRADECAALCAPPGSGGQPRHGQHAARPQLWRDAMGGKCHRGAVRADLWRAVRADGLHRAPAGSRHRAPLMGRRQPLVVSTLRRRRLAVRATTAHTSRVAASAHRRHPVESSLSQRS